MDGYFDGLVDNNGNLNAYGQWMVSKGWARRTGDGAVLINGGVAAAGSPNNPNGASKNPDGSAAQPNAPAGPAAGGAGGTPPVTPPGTGTAGGTVATMPNSQYDPQGILIGADGNVYLYTRQYDPTANGGKGGYVQVSVGLGNPTTPGFSWDVAAGNTQIPAEVLKQEYTQALINKRQTEAAGTKLDQWHYLGMTNDGQIQVQKGDNTIETVSLSQMTDPTWITGHPGIDMDEVNRALADMKKMSQWSFKGVDPRTGAVSIIDGKNNIITATMANLADPSFIAAHPGLDLGDVQRGMQQINQQNYLGSAMQFPGSAGYQRGTYYQLPPMGPSTVLNPAPDPRTAAPVNPAPPTSTPIPGLVPPAGQDMTAWNNAMSLMGGAYNPNTPTPPPPPEGWTGAMPRQGGAIPGAAPAPAPPGGDTRWAGGTPTTQNGGAYAGPVYATGTQAAVTAPTLPGLPNPIPQRR